MTCTYLEVWTVGILLMLWKWASILPLSSCSIECILPGAPFEVKGGKRQLFPFTMQRQPINVTYCRSKTPTLTELYVDLDSLHIAVIFSKVLKKSSLHLSLTL